jgi:hypothetical protein
MMIRIAGGILTLFSDRYRGHTGGLPKQLKRSIEAFGISLCAGFTDWHIIGATVCLWMGLTLGYGNAIGPASTGGRVSLYKGMLSDKDPGPEIWQVGILLDNVWIALIFFGLLWSVPITIYSYYFYKQCMLIMPIAMITFPLSCAAGQIIQRHYGCEGWRSQQWAFGILMAMFTYLI